MNYSEEYLEELAEKNPAEIIKMLKTNQNTSILCLAIDAASYISDRTAVVPIFIEFLKHPKALVRESAVYGLSQDVKTHPEVCENLKSLIARELSEKVKAAALEIIQRAENFTWRSSSERS